MTVVRGTYQANLTELGIYARLKEHGFAPELLGPTRTAYRDGDVAMPVRRLHTPRLVGPLSKNMLFGDFFLGRVSWYRYYHEYLLGFDRAVRGSDILIPVDMSHPTTYQCLKQRPRAKVVVQSWENVPFNWPEGRPMGDRYRATLTEADLFIPLTKQADRTLKMQGVEAARRAQVYPGVDLAVKRPPTDVERASARKALGLREGEVGVSFVGRLEFEKGILTLLEAMPEVIDPVKLIVTGKGRLERVIRKRIQSYGIGSRVSLLGSIPHLEVQRRVLWGSDLFVLPSISTRSWREQFGQAALEAMASGLPVITSDCGALPEVVGGGTTGIPVASDMPADLASAINALAADAGLRQRLGEAGRHRAETIFDEKVNGAKLASILGRL